MTTPRPLLPPPLDKVPPPFLYLGAGAFVALLLHFLTFGIFEKGTHSLFHEGGGHAVAGWLLGIPSVPAITVTWTYEPRPWLAALIWIAIGAAAWQLRARKPLVYFLGAAAAVYPFLAFTGAAFALTLAAGHLGEIGWAAFFFYRALRGGAFSEGERPLYAALAWPLFTQNVVLFFHLATSALARLDYETNSVNEGIQNDFIRFSSFTHIPLPAACAVMCLLSVVVPPLGIFLGYRASNHPVELPSD